MDHQLGTLPDRVALSPAERALMVEQATTLMVELDLFIKHCKDGTAGEAIRGYQSAHKAHEYIVNILNHKIGERIEADHEEGREH